MLRVAGSRSANTGLAPARTTALAQETNVKLGSTTSSPGPTPESRTDASSAELHELRNSGRAPSRCVASAASATRAAGPPPISRLAPDGLRGRLRLGFSHPRPRQRQAGAPHGGAALDGERDGFVGGRETRVHGHCRGPSARQAKDMELYGSGLPRSEAKGLPLYWQLQPRHVHLIGSMTVGNRPFLKQTRVTQTGGRAQD